MVKVTQAWYFMEATKAIASMPSGVLWTVWKLQFPQAVPFTEEKMVPLPFQKQSIQACSDIYKIKKSIFFDHEGKPITLWHDRKGAD